MNDELRIVMCSNCFFSLNLENMLWKSKDTAIKLKTHSDYCYRCSTTGQLHKLLFPSISISKSFLIFRNYRFKLCSHFSIFVFLGLTFWFHDAWLYIYACLNVTFAEVLHCGSIQTRLKFACYKLSLWSVLTEQSIVDIQNISLLYSCGGRWVVPSRLIAISLLF